MTGSYDSAELFEVFGEVDGRELLRLADIDLRARLTAFRESLDVGDLTAAAKAAHSIAGVSGNIMALPLSDLAREVEHELLSGTPLTEKRRREVETEVEGVLAAAAYVLAG